MSLRFAVLGSGSRGNGTVVESGSTRVLVDCGFSLRETEQRLARLDCDPGDLSAVLVTHEHTDHVAGVSAFAIRHGLEIHATHGTLRASAIGPDAVAVQINGYSRFRIGDLDVVPYPVPHDARESCQFCFSDGRRRLGMLTDAGHITAHIIATLQGCDALFLEANHDPEMLREGPYHAALKRRVGGDYGHLSNHQAAGLLRKIDTERLQYLVAGHLSENNNSPGIATTVLAEALAWEPERVKLAGQADGHDWVEIH